VSNYRLIVEISTGNDTMQTGHEIAEALRSIAKRLDDVHYDVIDEEDRGRVMDINGNRVGGWSILEEV
jgi:hypothetical protein